MDGCCCCCLAGFEDEGADFVGTFYFVKVFEEDGFVELKFLAYNGVGYGYYEGVLSFDAAG